MKRGARSAFLLHRKLSFRRRGSHAWYTSSRNSRSYFFDNYEPRCFCVYNMRVCVFCGRAILNITTWTIPTHVSFEFRKHARSTGAVQQQQQQRSNTSEPHIAYSSVYTTPRVVYHPPRGYTARAKKKKKHPKTTSRFITGVRCIPHPLRCHA